MRPAGGCGHHASPAVLTLLPTRAPLLIPSSLSPCMLPCLPPDWARPLRASQNRTVEGNPASLRFERVGGVSGLLCYAQMSGCAPSHPSFSKSYVAVSSISGVPSLDFSRLAGASCPPPPATPSGTHVRQQREILSGERHPVGQAKATFPTTTTRTYPTTTRTTHVQTIQHPFSGSGPGFLY